MTARPEGKNTMVACGKCQVQNSLDSSFCRRCGTVLDAETLQEARSELGRTVAQGFVLFNEGKVDESALIAEMAIVEDPTLTTAISLKGMCHERRGELSEALASYEKVLEVAPDSALDRIKVSQLRAAIAAKASIVEEERAQPDRKMALAVAVLAVVFFGGVGVLAQRLIAESRTRSVVASNTRTVDPVESSTFADTTPKPATAPQPATNPANQQTATVGNVRPIETPANANDGSAPQSGRNATDNTGIIPIKPFGDGGGALPDPYKNPVVTQTGPIGAGPTSTPINPNRDPDPTAPDPGKGPRTAPPADPVEDPGEIQINVSNRAPRNSGGSQAVDDGSSSQNLSKIASQEFQLKRYDSAAKKYEKLLRAGGDPAHVNQRLAQCYENLGKKSDAVNAYQRAAQALKDKIGSGKGNTARDKAALESCEAAIKVLNEGA